MPALELIIRLCGSSGARSDQTSESHLTMTHQDITTIQTSSTEPVFISDCTLRDLRNAPGVYFSDKEAQSTARLLASLNIDELEVGIINNASDKEVAFIKSICDLGLSQMVTPAFIAMKSADIEPAVKKSIQAGCTGFLVTLAVSPMFLERKLRRSFRAACKLMEKSTKAACAAGLSVVCSGEDAGRAPLDQLIDFAKVAEDSGASRFRFAETVACLSPTQMADTIDALKDEISIPIEVHCHSAFGLGVPNSIAALDAGAKGLSLTVEGLGERGGNTSLSTMLMYLWRFRGHDHLDLSELKNLSHFVADTLRLPIHRFTPIVGDSAFEFEYGNQFLHSDLYEAFDPALVGNQRRLAFGLKGDTTGLKVAFGDDEIKSKAFAARAQAFVREQRSPLYHTL